ncbi:MAG: restriction endonuclease subunit S, partial [Tissierellia bacterium]|nr:restriction endonuclease subunit S [Tissierellia bacterium]
WEQRKLGEVGTTFNGLSGKNAGDFGHGEAKFITYLNVFSNPITNPKMIESVEVDLKQNEVEIGDVFFTTSSETPEEVGMSSVLKEKNGVTYLNSFCFGFRPYVKFDLDYLASMLRTQSIRKQIVLLAQGISRFNISKTKMMETYIMIPRIMEQETLGKYFINLNDLITLHQREHFP